MRARWDTTLVIIMNYRPLSRRLDRVIQNQSFGGTTKWVSSLTLDCNGVFAIKAYCGAYFLAYVEYSAR